MKAAKQKFRLPKALASLARYFDTVAAAEREADLDSAICAACQSEASLSERAVMYAQVERSRARVASEESVLLHLIRSNVGDPLVSHVRAMRIIHADTERAS